MFPSAKQPSAPLRLALPVIPWPWLQAWPVQPENSPAASLIVFELPATVGATRKRPVGFPPTGGIASTALVPAATVAATRFRPPVVSAFRPTAGLTVPI